MSQKFFIGYHKDNNIIKKSSSGGAFTALTDMAFNDSKKVSVYGCILNENLDAIHIRATSKEERNKMRGSKYISSNVSGCYKTIEKDLKEKEIVIFTGTPCQIAGVYSYLKNKNIKEDNLLTIEVICHGVGSNKFFHDYISNLEKKYNSKAISCNFRAKSKQGKLQDMEVTFSNKKKYNASSTSFDWFFSVYLKNMILRPSCYFCKFACKKRNADISIADAWGNNNDKKSLSLLISNTEKGSYWTGKVKDVLQLQEIEKKDVHQPNMHSPSTKPDNYDEFWNIYNKKGYLKAQSYIGNNTVKGKIKVLLADIVNKLNLTETLKKLKKR